MIGVDLISLSTVSRLLACYLRPPRGFNHLFHEPVDLVQSPSDTSLVLVIFRIFANVDHWIVRIFANDSVAGAGYPGC